MSKSATPAADPFEATTLDEETELVALANALRLSKGFRLFFARCNQPSQRTRLMAELKSRLSPDAVAEVRFTEPIPHLLDALWERLPSSMPNAVFVSGLEYSLPVAAEAENTPFIANLNSARNSFPATVPCPVVVWLPEYALTAIVRGAPDFFSIRSGVYFFAASPEETTSLATLLIAGDTLQVKNYAISEKQERITLIERLLNDYQSLPIHHRDYPAEARLLLRMGHLHTTLGQWMLAEEACRKGLHIWLGLDDRGGEGAAFDSLGNVYERQGRWAQAEEAYRQSLQISLEVEDRYGGAQTLNNLGNVYHGLSRLTDAEQAYREALHIFRELAHPTDEAATLNNLGSVYLDQERLTEAEQAHQQSLQIRQAHKDRYGEGTALGNLGIAFQQQGRWKEAEQSHQHALQIFRDLGCRHEEGQTLSNLAVLKEAEGDLAQAVASGRDAIKVLVTTEDEHLLRRTQAWVEEWERFVEDESLSAHSTSDA